MSKRVRTGLSMAVAMAAALLILRQVRHSRPPIPDTLRPSVLERGEFRLKYPRNWVVDGPSSDYDQDLSFLIDNRAGGSVMLKIDIERTDTLERAKTIADRYASGMRPGLEKGNFPVWGRYRGAGVKLSDGDSVVRVFAHASEYSRFLVVETSGKSDWARLERGYRLIETSFELR